MKTLLERMTDPFNRISKEERERKMKHRNYFIMFCIGVAFATSLLSVKMALLNYILFFMPMLFVAIAYIIAITRDTYK